MLVIDNMKNQFKKLSKVQGTLSLKFKPRKKKRKTNDPYKDYWDNAEVFYTQKRVKETTHGNIDTKQPRCFGMAPTLSARKKAREANNFDHHRVNVENMLRRMNELGSMADRKRNPHDPIAYPVTFLRRKYDSQINTTIAGFAKQIFKNSTGSSRPTTACSKRPNSNQTVSRSRDNSPS